MVRERKDHQEGGVIDVRKGSKESEESVEADSPNGDQGGETIGDNNLLLNFEDVDHSAHSFLDGAGVNRGDGTKVKRASKAGSDF